MSQGISYSDVARLLPVKEAIEAERENGRGEVAIECQLLPSGS